MPAETDPFKSPPDELRALGLTVAVDDETATRIWIELMRIDARVQRKHPEFPAHPVSEAYNAIASHVVNLETPDQVLEEVIPTVILKFYSARPWWSQYGSFELLQRVLKPCIQESKITRLAMSLTPRLKGIEDPDKTSEPKKKSNATPAILDSRAEAPALAAIKIALDSDQRKRAVQLRIKLDRCSVKTLWHEAFSTRRGSENTKKTAFNRWQASRPDTPSWADALIRERLLKPIPF